MDSKKGRGRPVKYENKRLDNEIEKTLIRWREPYNLLKEELKVIAKNSGTSLNDLLLKISNDYFKKFGSNRKKEIDETQQIFNLISKNLNNLIKFHESEIQLTNHTEQVYFKDFILKKIPNLLEITVFFCKLIYNQMISEKQLLDILFLIDDPHDNLLDYIDFYIDTTQLGKNPNRKEIYNKFLNSFYNGWFLQLEIYNLSEQNNNFTINKNSLENFVLNELYSHLELKPIYSKNRYKKLEFEWKEIIKTFPLLIKKESKTFNLENIIGLEIKIYDKIDFIARGLGLDLMTSDDLKEASEEFKDFDDYQEYVRCKEIINTLIKLRKEFPIISIFSYLSKDNQKETLRNIQAKDFTLILDYFLSHLIKGDKVFETEQYDLSVYLNKIFTNKIFHFKPYIINKILKYEDFYQYLKKNKKLDSFLEFLSEILWI